METDGQYAIVIECFKYAETVKFVDSNLAFSPYVFYIFLFFIPYEKKGCISVLISKICLECHDFFLCSEDYGIASSGGGEGK